MIVLIMIDKLPFGAPPILACLLLVVTGVANIQDAFSGFVNQTVVMVAGFLVVMAALMKTSLINRVQTLMISLVKKGGYKSYILLILVVMLGASLTGPASTGYYVLILSLVMAIPYDEKLPTSKLLMPLGFSTYHPLIPLNVTLFYGTATSVLTSSQYNKGLSMPRFSIVMFIVAIGFFIWSLISYKFLPKHSILEPTENSDFKMEKDNHTELPKWQEILTVCAFLASVVGMMMMNALGEIAYVIPGVAAAVLLCAGVLDFKEVRDNMAAPLVLMLAGVIGVANALVSTGLTELVGNHVAHLVGNNINQFLFVLIFVLLTSLVATFTGANIGSVYIFAPIAIATCISMGNNPSAVAVAIAISGWNCGSMPIDGTPAMVFGMGKYTFGEFWKFTIPEFLIRTVTISIGAVLLFPM
jgi:di/tricarboxylate transporter